MRPLRPSEAISAIRRAVSVPEGRHSDRGRQVTDGRKEDGMVRGEVHSLVPFVRVMRVLPQLRLRNMLGALISYHSLRVKGSMIFFLDPFLPFVRRLFLLHSAARVRTRRRSGGGIVHVLLEVLVETLTKVVHILHHSLQQQEDPWRRRRMLGICRLDLS